MLDGSSSTKAKIDNKITEINEPTICTKLMAKANKPQNIGKLTSKNTHINPVNRPVNALTKNFTLINLIRSFSIFIKVLIDVCFRFNNVLLSNLCTLIDSANHSTTKKTVINNPVKNDLKTQWLNLSFLSEKIVLKSFSLLQILSQNYQQIHF